MAQSYHKLCSRLTRVALVWQKEAHIAVASDRKNIFSLIPEHSFIIEGSRGMNQFLLPSGLGYVISSLFGTNPANKNHLYVRGKH